jgi:phosphate-selective porin
LLGTNATDFINRSRIVEALAQRRDIGLRAAYLLSPELTLSGGMFNGNNQRLENSNNTFYYTGRLRYVKEFTESSYFSAAINAGFSEENGTQIGSAFLPAVDGDRTVYGGDFRFEADRFLLSAEALFADLEYGPQTDDEVAGYHITGGYAVTPASTLYLRLDHIESDVVDIPVENQVVAAFSHNFSSVTNFQFNYLLNPDDFELSSQYWLAQVQLGF